MFGCWGTRAPGAGRGIYGWPAVPYRCLWGCHQAVLEAQQLLCHHGVLGVMAVICWTGGSHDGLLLSHHLVPATRHGDWYKSNPFCSGGLGKTNGCFQVQERKCQRCSPDRLAVSWEVVVLLELNAEGSHEHMRTSLGALEEWSKATARQRTHLPLLFMWASGWNNS